MKKAFILSRPSDFCIAQDCQNRMISLGWNARIVIDPREWQTAPESCLHAPYGAGNGMFGNRCALAIVDCILTNSTHGDVVMKMDCDIWLSQEASEWFSIPTKAKALRVHYGKLQTWGGCWSSTREQLIEAREIAETFEKCNCAESFLNLKAFCMTKSKLEVGEIVNQWTSGERGFAATLPISKTQDRKHLAMQLFN